LAKPPDLARLERGDVGPTLETSRRPVLEDRRVPNVEVGVLAHGAVTLAG
jgi:hypothetical protein